MTSTVSTRPWLSAVVRTRSSASVAIWTAVRKPKVISVPSMSLSMVLGTPITRRPASTKGWAQVMVPSPPMTTRASMPSLSMRSRHWGTRSS